MSVVPPFMQDRAGDWYLTQQYVAEGPRPENEPTIIAMEVIPIKELLDELIEEVTQ